jgi:hypothetical protein
MEEEGKAYLDREKIRDCITRLARGEDRRDAGVLRACFWSDSSVAGSVRPRQAREIGRNPGGATRRGS